MGDMNKYLILVGFTFVVGCTGLQSKYHRVEEGDSLRQIAGRYEISEKTLVSYNESKLKNGLKTGIKLFIPQNPLAKVRVVAKNEVKPALLYDEKSDFSPVFIWPIKGVVSSKYGKRGHRKHEGIDIAAPSGTPIKAARSGHVIYSSKQISGYGNMVILKHADQFSTVYAHLSKIIVKKGDFVSRGQLLGLVGKTGRASSPHLHFEVRNRTIPEDPMMYLQGRGQLASNKYRQ